MHYRSQVVQFDALQLQTSAHRYAAVVAPPPCLTPPLQDTRPTTARPSTRDPSAIRAAPRATTNPDARPMTSNRVRTPTRLHNNNNNIECPREPATPKATHHAPLHSTPSAAPPTPARPPKVSSAGPTHPPWAPSSSLRSGSTQLWRSMQQPALQGTQSPPWNVPGKLAAASAACARPPTPPRSLPTVWSRS